MSQTRYQYDKGFLAYGPLREHFAAPSLLAPVAVEACKLLLLSNNNHQYFASVAIVKTFPNVRYILPP